jgi:hypothetical protein
MAVFYGGQYKSVADIQGPSGFYNILLDGVNVPVYVDQGYSGGGCGDSSCCGDTSAGSDFRSVSAADSTVPSVCAAGVSGVAGNCKVSK